MAETMLAGKLAVDVMDASAFSMQEVPLPTVGHGQVRVKVAAAGVCLSDVHMIGGLRSPIMMERNSGQTRTLGHEVSGTIDQVGPGVAGWREGERVTLQALRQTARGVETMGVDYDGGWASYVVASADVLVRIPDSLSFAEAAIIPDAVSTPWAAIVSTAQVKPGEAVAVWGCGGLGVHAIQLLRLIGAAPIVVVDPREGARRQGLGRGADVALDPTAPGFAAKLLGANGDAPFDVMIDVAGYAGIPEQALPLLGPGGRLVLVGLSGQPISVQDSVTFIAIERKLLGHYGSLPDHVPQLVRLAALGRLDLSASISRTLPLTEAPEAVRRLREKDGDPIRLVLDPQM